MLILQCTIFLSQAAYRLFGFKMALNENLNGIAMAYWIFHLFFTVMVPDTL